MRVAAYCRVSTDQNDQINSLENQIMFFDDYIKRNPDWVLVGIYSDEGVTGTSVSKRVRFSEMIRDAMDGKIDLILTKEVSRFARNTVDALEYTRELRRRNVGVYFISDNINTLEGDGEFRLSIMACVAQEESRKTSTRVKWGMRRRMERGFVVSPPMLGYDCCGGTLTVNENEANVVRRIFDLYVNERMGTTRIARMLTKEGVPLYKRLKSWSPTAVMRILKNEKYVGDLIQQKTTVDDFLTHKSSCNRGERIVFRDHHEPIVEREIWERAQKICAMRTSCERDDPDGRYRVSQLSGKVRCGVCGGKCVERSRERLYGVERSFRCVCRSCTGRSYADERALLECVRFALRCADLDGDAADCLDRIVLLGGGTADIFFNGASSRISVRYITEGRGEKYNVRCEMLRAK